MSLVNLTEFWKNKSIKLSDSFQVLIQYKSDSAYDELYNCNGFTIPKPEFNEETLDYGNVSQIFLVPKYDSNNELTLDFYEHMDDNDKSNVIHKVFENMGYTLTQKYGQDGLATNKATYNLDKTIHSIKIQILDNKLWRYVYFYEFTKLKISNYTMYSLDAQSDNAVKVSVTFTFEGSKRGIMNLPVDYPPPPPPVTNEDILKEEIELDELINNPLNLYDELLPPPTDVDILATEELIRQEEEQEIQNTLSEFGINMDDYDSNIDSFSTNYDEMVLPSSIEQYGQLLQEEYEQEQIFNKKTEGAEREKADREQQIARSSRSPDYNETIRANAEAQAAYQAGTAESYSYDYQQEYEQEYERRKTAGYEKMKNDKLNEMAQNTRTPNLNNEG